MPNALLVVAVLTYVAWGTAFAPVVNAGVIGFLVFWFWWASHGMSPRRKMQIASFAEPREGVIHATFSSDVSKVLKWIEEERKRTKEHITVTHVVGKLAALALKDCPQLTGRIVLDRFVPHPTIDISFLTAIEGGRNLAKVKVTSIDSKSVSQIANELSSGSQRLRTGKKTSGPLQFLPVWLVRIVLEVVGYLAGALGVDFPPLGVEAFPFGSCVITSVGMLGIDHAFAPFTPFCRVGMLLLIGNVKDGVIVENGEVVVRPKLKITATLDHRFVDGSQAAIMVKRMKEAFDDPEKYLSSSSST
ncbi:2-oxo acid dehydrogenase subunit E2 [Balamuthia mandrillaris]